MRTFKVICLLIVFSLAAVVAYQNTAVMQIKFLFWSVSMSAALMVPAVFFAGFIAGLLLFFLRSRKKASKPRQKINGKAISQN